MSSDSEDDVPLAKRVAAAPVAGAGAGPGPASMANGSAALAKPGAPSTATNGAAKAAAHLHGRQVGGNGRRCWLLPLPIGRLLFSRGSCQSAALQH
jgi:hypothetical protein